MVRVDLENEPIALVGENLLVLPERKYGYYKVEWLEEIQDVDYDFGSIAAESETEETEVSNLYMSDGEIGSWMIKPIDDVEVKVSQPSAIGRYKTKEVKTSIKAATELRKRGILFVWEDEKVYFTVKNPTKYPLDRSKVRFKGLYRYQVRKLPTAPERYSVIVVEGKGGPE
jgi:cysteinyl-tRNA synthetase